jgi:processive 1,2-diacylglycerol beta-glucosyltransferase
VIQHIFAFFALFILATEPLHAQSKAHLTEPTPLKKVIILTSKGGSGHMSTSQELQFLLKDTYQVSIINPFEEILSPIDFVKKISFGSYDGESLYNSMIQSGWIRTTNFFCRYIAPKVITWQQAKEESLFYDYFCKEQPDLVISVIPVLNLPASNAAHRRRIPYLIISLDCDLTMWTVGMEKALHTHMVITTGNEEIAHKFIAPLKNQNLHKIKPIGFPIRNQFFEKKDIKKIKTEWDIPTDKPVVAIIMGGAGSNQTYRYFKALARCSFPLHVLACVGRNTKIIKRLKKIKCNPLVSLSCIPFTDKISDLMAASDLLITKPGPGSMSEAAILKLPMLIDAVATNIFWEKEVTKFVLKNKLGYEVKSFSKLRPLVKNMLFDKKTKKMLGESFDRLPPYRFNKEILSIITSMCPPTR